MSIWTAISGQLRFDAMLAMPIEELVAKRDALECESLKATLRGVPHYRDLCEAIEVLSERSQVGFYTEFLR